MSKERIGFIGTGVMGSSMAGHLMEAGHPLTVFNRSKEKAASLIAKGARWGGSPGEVAAEADVVITIVGYPRDVESVYLGSEGILAKAPADAITIDMTTSSPVLAQRLSEEGAKRGLRVLDAPVSGGDSGAREARLSIMVGGDRAAFEAARPMFEVMGKNIVYQGPAGSGQYAKLCNQIAIAGGLVAIGESLALAKRAGLDIRTMLKSIQSGAAGSWSLSNLAPKALDGDYAPGFYVKHFIKDMRIAMESADEMGLELPGLELAASLYQQLADEGYENEGTQALLRLYLEAAGA